MNTIFETRVFGDPRFYLLARELKDPCRAAGALLFLWSGTQNRKLVVATQEELLTCFPPGYRGAKSVISALYRSGWLQRADHDESAFRIAGNEEHVLKKEEISQRNRTAANARWGALRMPGAFPENASGNASGINPGCVRHATQRIDPLRIVEEEERENARAIGSNHPELRFFEAEYLRLWPGDPLTKQERSQAAEIIRRCADAKRRWQDVLEAYAGGWAFSKHTIRWLHGNLREVLNASAPPPKPKRRDYDAEQAAALAEADADLKRGAL